MRLSHCPRKTGFWKANALTKNCFIWAEYQMDWAAFEATVKCHKWFPNVRNLRQSFLNGDDVLDFRCNITIDCFFSCNIQRLSAQYISITKVVSSHKWTQTNARNYQKYFDNSSHNISNDTLMSRGNSHGSYWYLFVHVTRRGNYLPLFRLMHAGLVLCSVLFPCLWWCYTIRRFGAVNCPEGFTVN